MAFNRNISINVTSNTTGLQSGMNTAVSSVKQATASMKTFGGAANSLAQGPLQNFQGNLQTLPKQMDAVGNSATKTGGRLRGLGEAVKGNRGLVFGFAGLTSAMAESVGMFGMYGDAAKMVEEDQALINKLTAEGAQNTHEYKQAQQELLKHSRFLNMAQRNTALSLMDNVFFTTMAINGLIELGSKGTKVTGVLSKMKGAITGLSMAHKGLYATTIGGTGLVAGVSALETIMGKTGRTVDGTTKAVGGLRAAILLALGPVAAIALAIGLAIDGITTTQKMANKAMNENPEMFAKDKSGNVDKSWFGPNSLFGSTLSGKPLPTIKGEDPSKESFMGKILQGIPGYKELGKVIGDIAGTQYPDLIKSADAASTSIGGIGFVQEEWNNNIQKQLPNLKKIWEYYSPQIRKGILDTDMMTQSTQAWTKAAVENGEMSEGEAAALNFMVAKRAEAVAKLAGNEQAANEAAKKAAEEKMKMEDDLLSQKMKAMIVQQEVANRIKAEKNEMRWAAVETVGYNKAFSMTEEQLARSIPIIAEVTGGIHAQYELVKSTAEAWTHYTDEQFQADIAQQQTIYSSIQLDEILVKNKKNVLLYNQARIAGKQAVADFVKETELGLVSEREQEAQLTKLIGQYGIKLPAALDLSVTQLQAVWAAFRDGRQEAVILADILSQQLAPAFAKVLEASRTLAEGGKDAKKNSNKQLKDMHVPKFLDDDVKKQRDRLASDLKKGMDIYDTFNAMAALDWEGKLNGKDLGKGVDFIIEKLSKFKDPEAVDFGNWLAPGFEKLNKMSEEQRQVVMTKLIPAWDKIFGEKGLFTDGDITASDLAAAQQLVRDAFNTSIDPVKQTGEATKQYNEEMIKIEANAIVVDAISGMWTELATNMIAQNVLIAGHWTLSMISVLLDAITTTEGVNGSWAGLVKTMNKSNVQMANKWQTAMKNVVHNSTAAVSQTASQFAALVKKLNSNFVKIANNWEKAMRNVVQNAKAAASQVNSALAKIKDKTVTITYQKKGEGGVIGKAEGGIISAAHGFTTSGPQLLLVGDNPGGRETIAAIPHDSPRKTMDELNRKFGTGQTSGNVDIYFNPTIVIGQDKLSFTQRYRVQQGESVANQV